MSLVVENLGAEDPSVLEEVWPETFAKVVGYM
jgi:hypothetical protein